ncbi:uncharacterized protein LOC121375211 [Gigantopelta aegis]|uniref:uncharacterized protein LOC121375211 n=1 Tax=Gigantopelta aegis TaxID=1735272 RepID=UPI001B889502|nr:uncharacterized protein LOC121375211 [Gigantopelta aegis]
MGTCCSASANNRVDLTHVDLQETFERYIWKVLCPIKIGKCRAAFLRHSHYNVEIKWEYLDQTSETSFPGGAPVPEEIPVVLHHAAFDNTSGKEQKFIFSTIKETKAVSTFTFSEVFSIGTKYSIGVNIPSGPVLGAEITGSYSITKGRSETFENKIQWDMHSEITVEDKTSAEAVMQVHEEITSQPIVVTTKFFFAMKDDQRLPFVVRHKRTGQIFFVGDIQVLKAPLEYYYEQRVKNGVMPPMLSFNEDPEKVKGTSKKVKDNRLDDIIIIRTSGLSKTTAWKNHHITVNKTSDKNKNENVVSPDQNGAEDGQ